MAMTSRTTFFLCITCALHVFIFIADVKATEAVSNTISTDNSTESSTEWKPQKSLSRSEKNGVVTLELVATLSTETLANISQRLPVIVAKILNRVKSPASEKSNETLAEDSPTNSTSSLVRRRRSSSEGEPELYSDDGVGLVEVDPIEKDGKLRVAVVAVDQDGNILAAAQLRDKLEENKNEISAFVGFEVESIYAGLPMSDSLYRPTVWDIHRNLFYGILILLGVALLVLAICCLCFYCCRRRRRSSTSACGPKKELKQPIPDEEMVELAPVVPLQSAPPQQASPQVPDIEQPAADDDEHGWIVPLDQLSHEELDQSADTQISKL